MYALASFFPLPLRRLFAALFSPEVVNKALCQHLCGHLWIGLLGFNPVKEEVRIVVDNL